MQLTPPHSDNGLLRATCAVVFVLALGWLLHAGRDVLVPIVLGLMLVYAITGLARLVALTPVLGPRLPPMVCHGLSIVLMVVVLMYAARMLIGSLGTVVALAPQYEAALLNLIQAAAERVGLESTPTWDSLRRDLLVRFDPKVIGSTLVSVTAIAAWVAGILLYGAFLLLEQRAFAGKLDRLSADPARGARLRAVVTDINARIGTYIAMKTLVSIIQGAATWAVLAGFGLQFAAFWGVLTGLLNFIPYVGTVLSIAFPLAWAAMQFGDFGTVLAVLAALSATQFITGFVLDPLLMGRSLNLSPLVILISVALWAALWGLPGAFLGVPLTACIALVCAQFESTRAIAVLLSADGTIEGAPAAAAPGGRAST